MRKKLLYITTRVFWPANSGRKVSLYYYCKGLHERFDYDIYVYSFLEAEQNINDALSQKPDFITSIRFAKQISKLTKAKNLLFKSITRKFWPLQCALFYDEHIAQEIETWVKDNNFDVIVTDMIRTAPYYEAFKDSDCIKICNMDDLLSKRYQRTLDEKDSNSNILGQYSKFLPDFFVKHILPLVKNHILKFEIKRLMEAENYYASIYDKTVFVSELETQSLNARLKEEKCYTVSLGVDYSYFSEEIEVNQQSNAIAFVGNFGYSPNLDSLSFIANRVLPDLPRDIKLYVIGKISEANKSNFSDERIVFCGQVDDLRYNVKKASVFLSPILYGSGIKTKILEAMAMGMPVITNSIGAEGLNVTNGKELIIAEDAEGNAKKVMKLLSDPELREKVGKQGQEYVHQYHDWERVYDAFAKMNL